MEIRGSEELARLDAIRDCVGSRVKAMAQSRVAVGRRHIPISVEETVWLQDQERTDMIPPLDPQEYWALITALHRDLCRSARQQVHYLEQYKKVAGKWPEPLG